MKHHLQLLLLLVFAISCHNKKDATSNNPTSMTSESFQPKTSISSDLSMFPPAPSGQRIVAIELPAKANEGDFQIEVFVGKTIEVDCNSYFMMGTSENVLLDGWGYSYTVISSGGEIAGTKMGCLDNVKRTEFVHMAPLSFAYNSNLPVVLYVPQFCEVKYRVWTANENLYDAINVASTSEKQLIRDCPDEKIMNAMPTDGVDGLPKVYYIYKGVRKELNEFDEEWVAKNCKVKTTVAY